METYVDVIASGLGQPSDSAFRFRWHHDSVSDELILIHNPVDITTSYVTAKLQNKNMIY